MTTLAANTVVKGSNTALSASPTPAVHTTARIGATPRFRSSRVSRRRGDDGRTSTAADNAIAANTGGFMPASGFAAAREIRRSRR